MIKKLLGILLVFCMLAPSVFAYTDVGAERSDYEAIHRLGDLGIISGYADGSFLPQKTITRGEFARLIVSALGKDKEAKSLGYNANFADVESGLWSAPYINYVSGKGIVSGYSDGYFQPEKTISFAETLTILLRMIDYKEDSVGYYWPNNYVDAASSLGISEGFDYQNGEAVTRGDVAVMLDRTLFTDLCGREDSIILEGAGFKVVRDTVVLSNGREVKLSDSNTYTSKMSVAIADGQFADYAVVDKNSNLVALKLTGESANTASYSKAVYVNAVTDDTVSYVSNGVQGSYRFDNSFTVYNDGQKQTFAQAKGSITAGCDLTFYGEQNGAWDFAVIGADNVKPALATHNYSDDSESLEGIAINTSGLVVYRDGKSAKLSDIKTNDVVYYNTKSNVMDVYSKKVTGVYYEALPSKSFVETVKVGGKSYEIGGDVAAARLGANAGSFEIGDRVTLLLGKNDKAVFAVELTETAVSDYGVVLSVGTELADSGINEGATELYADIFMTDGEEHRIVTANNYDNLIGSLVRIAYENGKAKLQSVGTVSGYSGEFNSSSRTLNGKTIMRDAVIIQRTSYNEEQKATCELLDLDTMTAKSISDSQLLGVITGNSFGDISVLYVKDVESTADFGVVSNVEVNEAGGARYTIYSNGAKNTYTTDFIVSQLGARTPVMFDITGGGEDVLKKLYNIADGSVQAADGSRIKMGGKVYSLSPDVQIVKFSDYSGYSTLSIDALTNGTVKNASIYSDTSSASACVIRIIMVE